jgi:hypothetical protein
MEGTASDFGPLPLTTSDKSSVPVPRIAARSVAGGGADDVSHVARSRGPWSEAAALHRFSPSVGRALARRDGRDAP